MFYGQENYTHTLTTSQEKQIDSLFVDYGDPNKPGVIMAILHNNQLVYQKSFGSAAITPNTPITKETKFQLAVMAKHFTAYAILLLEQQQKLSVDDPLYTYVPELANLPSSIRLKDLLRNSDGLHDYNALKRIAGKSNDVGMSNADIIKVLKNVTSYNFEAGKDYEYTDTGMILLTEVIKKVTGVKFSEFMRKEVFEPAGMMNTLFVDTKNTVPINVAIPYVNRNDQYVRGKILDHVYGVSNFFSTIEDLVKWEQRILNAKGQENGRLLIKLNELVALDTGRRFRTSLGNLTYGQQFEHKERGLSSTYHTGSYSGYASSMFRFPDQNYAAIVLSNNGLEYNGYFGVLAAHILLEDQFTEPTSIDINTLDIKPITSQELQKYAGNYWDQKGGFYRKLEVKNDTLHYVRTNGYVSPLVHLGNHKFQMVLDWDDKIFITFSTDYKTFDFVNGEAEPIRFERFVWNEITEDKAKAYVGTYYCEDLQIGYDIAFQNNQLIMKSIHNEDVVLTPIMKELFHGDQWYMRSITFKRNPKNSVLGYYTSMSDLNGVWFKRIE